MRLEECGHSQQSIVHSRGRLEGSGVRTPAVRPHRRRYDDIYIVVCHLGLVAQRVEEPIPDQRTADVGAELFPAIARLSRLRVAASDKVAILVEAEQ